MLEITMINSDSLGIIEVGQRIENASLYRFGTVKSIYYREAYYGPEESVSPYYCIKFENNKSKILVRDVVWEANEDVSNEL